VNRIRPAHRGRIRRLVILLALLGVAFGAGYAFEALDKPGWSANGFITADLLRAFLLVSLVATLAFSALLPLVRVDLPMIASDLLVGFGYIIATLGILSQHGLDPTGALVSGAVVSAVLAISLQQTLGNILGGIALQLDGSIHEGDWIQLENGKQGQVTAIRWRHTVVETRDWSTIIVPNAVLLSSNIMLLGKRDGAEVPQRMWVWFNVDFRFAPSRVVDVVTEALRRSPIENVAADPPPQCVCMDFSRDGKESFATYAARYWIVDLHTDDATQTRVRGRVYTALDRAGIPLAMPAHTAFVELQDEDRAKKKLARETESHLAVLRTVPLFRTLKEDELRALAAGMSRAVYANGELITKQGATAHWLYVMTAGTAEVRTNVDANGPGKHAAPAQSVRVARIIAPDFFGEMGMMTGETRSADVIAIGDVECFRLGQDTFKTVLLARPEIADELAETLAARRMGLIAVREGLDADALRARHASERERILGGIKSFFGL
jgi:small-conductance mechanosensitive channel/CRP-like cAMP-binding protein